MSVCLSVVFLVSWTEDLPFADFPFFFFYCHSFACLSAHSPSFFLAGSWRDPTIYSPSHGAFCHMIFYWKFFQRRMLPVPKMPVGHSKYLENCSQPWWWAALVTTVAFGARKPQPSVLTSSSKHGRWCMCLFCWNLSSTQVDSAATDNILVLLFKTHNTDGVGVDWQRGKGVRERIKVSKLTDTLIDPYSTIN